MKKILITAPIRQKPDILEEYLRSLDNLKTPEDCQIDGYFILHNCFNELKYMFHKDNVLEEFNDKTDDVRQDQNTHIWQDGNFKAIVTMKNKIKDYALKNNYDYVFMVDSDLILHPNTLNHLFCILEGSCENVIGEMFYTDWDKSGRMLPNCWDMDSYSFIKNPEIRYKNKNANVYQVGGTGACILIRTKIFENKSINYNPIQNISFSSWEDRAFCIRCYVNDIKVFIDTSFPAKHLYHD